MVPKTRWALAGIVFVVSLLGAAGCGSDDSSSGGAAKPDAPKPNGVASKSPKQIVKASVRALRDARSFHMEGTTRLNRKRTAVKVDYEQPGKVRLSLVQPGTNLGVITTGAAFYFKANKGFLRRQKIPEEATAALAGRWVRAPSSDRELRSFVADFDPKKLSRCLVGEPSSLSRGGTAAVDGQPAVVVIDSEAGPGTAPGKLFVAATGEPFPLRVLLTGDERPGGKPDPRCGGDDDPGDEGRAGDQLTFSRYNQAMRIVAPPNPLDLSSPRPATQS